MAVNSIELSAHLSSLNGFQHQKLRHIIPTVKPTRCTTVSNLFIFEKHSTCFGRPFRPSSGVEDCT
jgi:hypothetical protein